MNWLWYLLALLLMPLVAILLWFYVGASLAFWFFVLHWLGERFKSPPEPAYCDIDPRCHPAFVWAPDGSAWIGDVKINPKAL